MTGFFRQLKRPVNIYMDHTSAVTCIDYAPTGRELVTGSYDKTIRIYKAGQWDVEPFFWNNPFIFKNGIK